MHGRGLGVKYFSLLAIGKIGGPDAERVLLQIADQYGKVKAADSVESFSAICQALGYIGTAPAADKLESISNDTTITQFVRRQALSSYYLYRLKSFEFASAADSVDFLVSEMQSNFSSGINDMEKFIVTKAADLALLRINSPTVRSSLESEITAIVDNPELKRMLERTYEGMIIYQNK